MQNYILFANFEVRKTKLMLKIILILLCLTLSAPFSSSRDKGPSQISVMSYNIRQGYAKDGTNAWDLRYPSSAMMLDDQKPDVVGLQEAQYFQFNYLVEYPGYYKGVGVGRDDGRRKGEIMGILYNKKTVKLLKWGTFWLSETPDEPSVGWDAAYPRTATWALLKEKGGGKKFIFVNTHLDHKGVEARKRALVLIAEKIASLNPDGLPVVLTGDFNMEPGRDEFAPILSVMSSVRDVAPVTDHHSTFNGWGKGQGIIDYIFVRGFSKIISYETVTKPYMDRKFISDHHPIKAILEL